MLNRYECSLDGKPLSAISPSIFITDIREDAPPDRITAEPYAIHNGSRYIRKQRESLSVSVEFAIREQDEARRMEVCQLIQKWAKNGGYFARSDRPGQRLRVRCETLPSVASALKWTEILSVVFTAYELPYWESVAATTVTTTGKKAVFFPGTADHCRANATIIATGGTLTSLTITTKASTISLQGINIANGGKVEIGHDDNGYLFIHSGSTSLMAYRTETSDDDLLIPCGQSEINVSGNVAVSMSLSARGVWL